MNDKIISDYSGKRIVVTGASGFLGSNLVQELRNVDCEIIRITRSTTSLTSTQGKPQIVDLTGDIREPEIWKDVIDRGVDIIFHLAAQTSVAVANDDAVADHRANVLPMIRLAEACRRRKCRPMVVFAGTVTQAGLPTRLPVSEEHPDKPVTIYDLHKLIAERYLKFYSSQEIVFGAVLRLANVYGPGPTSSSSDRGVLSMMIRKALKGEPLTVYGKGDWLRDYVYVADVIRAFLLAGVSIDKTNGHHFVIGSGQGQTIREAFNLVADEVARKTGRRVEVILKPQPVQSVIETRNFVADSAKFSQATGWQPECSLAEGIGRTVQAFNAG